MYYCITTRRLYCYIITLLRIIILQQEDDIIILYYYVLLYYNKKTILLYYYITTYYYMPKSSRSFSSLSFSPLAPFSFCASNESYSFMDSFSRACMISTCTNTQHSTHVGEPHFLKRLTLKTRPHFLKRLILKTRPYSLKRLILKTSENTTTGAGKGWGCFLKTQSESSNHFVQLLPLIFCGWLVRVHLRSCWHDALAGRFRNFGHT